MNSTSQTLKKLASDIATFSDRFAVKADLAKKDAQDAWQNLLPVFHAQKEKAEVLASQMSGVKDELELQTYLGIQELAEKLDVAANQVEKIVATGRESVNEKIDLTKLRLELAAMEAESFFQAKKTDLEEKYHSSKLEFKTNVDDVVRRIADRYDKFTNQ